MEMFLMALCLSMLGVAATAVAFAAATRDEQQSAEAAPELKALKVPGPPRFFVDEPGLLRDDGRARVPIEALLLQIERHIRLERVAAESFLDCPTAESLHTRTESPLIH